VFSFKRRESAPAAAEFAAADGDDLDAGLAQQGVGVGVAVVSDHHARLDGHHVVAVVPLFARLFVAVASRWYDAQLREAKALRHHLEQRPAFAPVVDAATIGRVEAVADDLVRHVHEAGHGVAVTEREHGVQVHGRAGLRHLAGHHALHGTGSKQGLRQLPHRLRRGAFAHADQHHTVADGHDVAALQRGRAVVHVRVAPPHRKAGLRKQRVVPVHRRGQQGFLAPRGPVHGVEGDAAVNPCAGVAREQHVRQRWQHETVGPQAGTEHAGGLERQVVHRHTADEVTRQRFGGQFPQPALELVEHAHAHVVGCDLALQHPFARGRDGQGFREQLAHLQHLDAAVLHLGDEVEMVGACLLHPEHVVEQQPVAVRWRQAFVRQAGRAHQHAPQLAHLGIHAQPDCTVIGGAHGVHSSTAALRLAMLSTVSISISGQMKRTQRW